MEGLSTSQLAEFREAFYLFDKDGNGEISIAELGRVMRALGRNPTQLQLQEMINEIDSNASGTVEFPEFCKLMSKQLETEDVVEDDLVKAFKVFDKDGNGFIDSRELKDIMKGLGEVMTDKDIEVMISEADIDGDGKLNYQEFAKQMLAKQ